MTQYIDKDAEIAEIVRGIKTYQKNFQKRH